MTTATLNRTPTTTSSPDTMPWPEWHFQPLRITASLASGIAGTSPWGIALDGLIASELRSIQKQYLEACGVDITSAMDTDNPPDFRLPLARCTLDDTWHWAATCAYPEDPTVRVDVHTWTARTDARHLEQATARLPRVISDQRGRYKAYRMPLLVTPTRTLTWHAIGDASTIQELLQGITAIGKKRSQGEGRVLSWTVTPAPDLDEFTAAHCHPDGTLGRPAPPRCLADHPELQTRRGVTGARPPYMHPSRRAEVFLPFDHRAVLA